MIVEGGIPGSQSSQRGILGEGSAMIGVEEERFRRVVDKY